MRNSVEPPSGYWTVTSYSPSSSPRRSSVCRGDTGIAEVTSGEAAANGDAIPGAENALQRLHERMLEVPMPEGAAEWSQVAGRGDVGGRQSRLRAEARRTGAAQSGSRRGSRARAPPGSSTGATPMPPGLSARTPETRDTARSDGWSLPRARRIHRLQRQRDFRDAPRPIANAHLQDEPFALMGDEEQSRPPAPAIPRWCKRRRAARITTAARRGPEI